MSSSDSEKNLDYEGGTANVVEMHDSVRREKVLHPEGQETLGPVVMIVCAILISLGGGYLFANINGFSSDPFVRYYHADPRPGEDGGGDDGSDLPWIDRWMKGGEKTFNSCASCHGMTGGGQPGVYPPLKGSEWVDGGTERLGAIMMRGISGPFTVANQTYSQQMQAWNTLSDEKIAQVLTYVRRTFGSMPEGEDGVVTVEMVKSAREKYADVSEPWNEAGLLAIPADANLSGAKVDLQTGEPLP